VNGDDEEIQPRQTLYRQGGIQAIQQFGPGHLITAEDLNELVDAIKELDRRLRALE
jgi:hypothetical protein